MVEKVVVEMRNGDKLIGLVVEPTDDFYSSAGLPKEMLADGIWLKREKKVSFLGDVEIVRIRPVTIFDKEIDSASNN